MKMWKDAGIKVMPVVASVALAKLMERAGADMVIAGSAWNQVGISVSRLQ